MNIDYIHKSDIHDALQWGVREIRLRAPQGGLSNEPERSRLFILEQLRDEAQRDARK